MQHVILHEGEDSYRVARCVQRGRNSYEEVV